MGNEQVSPKTAEGLKVLRPAQPADLDAVLTLLAATRLPVQGVQEGFGEGYVVLEYDGVLAGAAGIEIHGQMGLLRSVVVSAARRDGGLGGALLRDRLAWCKSHRLKGVFLLTTTAADYFSRRGFLMIDRTSAPMPIQSSSEFRSVCPASAIVMFLPLADE